jgi:glycosyltransferase involved in cell wall biosynthesis
MKNDKVDVVMWAKNGEDFLPSVLRRIEEVVPSESVASKIMIDDHSNDRTTRIAASFGWEVYQNPLSGVSSGANEALRRVRSRRFVSVEHDLVLARDWWDKIPLLLGDDRVVAASGVRVPDKPEALRLISEYTNERIQRDMKADPGFRFGKTLDNTIYNTELLRNIGGFPTLRINAGVDGALVKRINDAEYEWKVDFSVKSVHLRRGLVDELRHAYWYGTESTLLSQVLEEEQNVLASTFSKALYSPLRGLQIALNKRCWQIAMVYPLIRVSIFIGVLRGPSKRQVERGLWTDQGQ